MANAALPSFVLTSTGRNTERKDGISSESALAASAASSKNASHERWRTYWMRSWRARRSEKSPAKSRTGITGRLRRASRLLIPSSGTTVKAGGAAVSPVA